MEMIKLLKHYGYGSVIIVDDKVNVNEDNITLQELMELDEEGILKKSLYKYGNPNHSIKKSQIDDEELVDFIKQVFIKEQNLFELINELSGLGDKLIKLKDFNDHSKIESIDGNAIWIIDRFLLDQDMPHIKDVFNKYLSRIDKGYMDIIVIYTRDLHDIDTYDKMKIFINKKISGDLTDKIMFINALSKDEKIDKSHLEEAIQKVAKVIVFNNYETESRLSIEEFRKKLYDSKYYKYLVDYDYLSEGKSAYQSFSDILFSTHRNNFYLNNHEKIDLVNKVNQITNRKYKELKENQILEAKLISRLIKVFHQKNRPYDIEKSFFKDNDELNIGDIFKIGKKYFLVISQECDLIIRENGKRKLDRIKTVEIKVSKAPINHIDFIKENLSSIAKNGLRDFKELNKVDDVENLYNEKIVDEAVKIINSNNENFTITSEEILFFNDNKFDNKDVIKYEETFRTISPLKQNIEYFDSWLLDGSIYYENHDDGYIIFSEKKELYKKSTQLRLDLIKIKLEKFKNEAIDKYNLDFDAYLKIKTDLKITMNSDKIKVPIKRIARLPHELVLKYIVLVSNEETRHAVDDIISI